MVDSPCPTCTLLSLQPKDSLKKRTSRVTELLRQNHPPLDVELADFRVVVDKSPEILQDLDEKIAQARETLDHLIQARKQAESHLADAKSLLHPIRRLPNEIISEIFFHCVPNWYTRFSFDSSSSLDPRRAPWTLTAVSRRWRDVTLSLPQLWTYLRFDSEQHHEYITPRQTVYKMTLFIERSKGYPLFIYMLGSNADLAVDPAFAALEVTIPRWKSLLIALPSLSVFSAGNIFSSLEHLIIFSANSNLNVNQDLFEAAKAPSLRVLEIRSRVLWRRFERLSLPWSQLTTVRDFSAFDTAGLDFLQKITNLADLEVNLGSECRTSAGTAARLPKVLRFVIEERAAAAPGRLEQVFQVLEMPSLSDLSISFPSVNRVHFFPDLFVGGCKRLVKLHIIGAMKGHADNTSNLLRFLSCTPCIQDFRLVDKLSVEFIVGLKVTSVPARLPCLRILDISACSSGPNLIKGTSVIYDMLQSRYAPLAEIGNSEDTQFARMSGSGVDVTMGATSSRVERPGRCLERVRVPRWLYIKEDQRWKEICGAIQVECGIVMKDDK